MINTPSHAPDSANAKVTVEKLSKSFGDKCVLDDISLSVPKGESFIIIGGSGSGKSVFLKNIIGLMQPDKGHIYIDGTDVTHADIQTRHRENISIGMLFQYSALFDSLSVWENIAFGLIHAKKMHKNIARDIAIEKLAEVGLSGDVAHLFPAELSGGMKKRVGLARAIAGQPDILFFDEPTTGLDPIMGHVIDDLIIKSVKSTGATAITITHDMQSAKRIGNKGVMLHQGKFVWQGDIKDLDSSDNPYIRQFVDGQKNGPIKMQILKP